MVNLWSTALGHRVKSDPSDLSIEFLVNIAPFLLCIRRLTLTPVSVMQDLDTQSLRYDTILHRSLSTHHNNNNNIAANSRLCLQSVGDPARLRAWHCTSERSMVPFWVKRCYCWRGIIANPTCG